MVTTRTAKRLGRNADLGPDMLYVNCQCGSTMVLTKRPRAHWDAIFSRGPR